MTEEELSAFYSKIHTGAKAAVSQAIERHRKLGEPIAIWQDGKVVVLSAEEIPQTQQDSQTGKESHA